MAGRAVYTKFAGKFGGYVAKQALYGSGAVVDFLKENNTSLAGINKGIDESIKSVSNAKTPLERSKAITDAKKYAGMKSDLSFVANGEMRLKRDPDGSKMREFVKEKAAKENKNQRELRESAKRRREMLSKR